MYSQGTNIRGGEFRAINQIIHTGEFALSFYSEIKSAGLNRVGIQVLSQAIPHGAMHDSAKWDPPPRCHPGTREKAIQDIIGSIKNQPHPPLSSGLAARGLGNRRSCRGSQNSIGSISEAAFSLGGAT